MGRSLWLADVLADAYRGVSGVRFEVYPGWQTRGRDGVRHIGVMNHHTGPGGYDALLRYMATNSSIAPLCNIASSHDGSRVTLVAAGKANHAGRGHLDWTGTDRGNWYTVGWEAQNDGAQPWPDKHLETVAIGNAALRNHMAVDLSRLVDHKTYAPGRKVDRHTIQLDTWRHRVASVGQQEEDDVLKRGDTGNEVRAMQADLFLFLKRHDRYDEGAHGGPDGDFGGKTEAAVKAAQGLIGYRQTGVYDLSLDRRVTPFVRHIDIQRASDGRYARLDHEHEGGGDHEHPYAADDHKHRYNHKHEFTGMTAAP